MKRIIWLTEWFPTSAEPYAGDGIERRAKAVSLYNDVSIIYVKKNKDLAEKKIQKEERIYNEHFRATIYHYPAVRILGRLSDVIASNYFFIRLHHRALRDYKKKYGKPAGIQVNVTMKNGIIALYYKWRWRINYIVAEGWSLFLPEAKPRFKDKDWLFRFLTRKVLQHASLLVTVSDHLGRMISEHIKEVPFQTIPSVVDTTIFSAGNQRAGNAVFRFIHISTLNHPKNFEQILQAVKIVTDQGFTMEMIVHGPDIPALKKLNADLGLANIVFFENEMPQAGLAAAMQQADALVLYSRYETFGNVIIEANACGLPVIVSDYPTFNEIVTEGINGLKAISNNPGHLAEKMIFMIQHYKEFDRQAIAKATEEKYNFKMIGGLFNEVYNTFFR